MRSRPDAPSAAHPLDANVKLLMWRSLIAVWVMFGSLPTLAADTNVGLAEKFVRLLRYSEQYTEYRRACIATGTTITPETLVRENTNRFEGILPSMKYWS